MGRSRPTALGGHPVSGRNRRGAACCALCPDGENVSNGGRQWILSTKAAALGSVPRIKDPNGLPSNSPGAAITVEMDWFGNGADDGNSRQIQSLVVGQTNTSGLPVEVSNV